MRNACNMSVLYRLQICVFSMFLFLHQAQNRKLEGNNISKHYYNIENKKLYSQERQPIIYKINYFLFSGNMCRRRLFNTRGKYKMPFRM